MFKVREVSPFVPVNLVRSALPIVHGFFFSAVLVGSRRPRV